MIIGICGSIGAGKDTVARILGERHGFWKVGWADHLKTITLDAFGPLGMETRHCYGTPEDKAEELKGLSDEYGKPLTARRILEWLGTEGFRSLDPDFWVKVGMRKAQHHLMVTSCSGVVIPDCRFPNEFDAIRNAGGEIWQVERRGGPEEQRTGHTSDTGWRNLPTDRLIENVWGNLDGLALVVKVNLERALEREDALKTGAYV